MKAYMVLLFIVLVSASACNARLQAPSGFAVVPTRGDMEYKAVSPKGIVVAISRHRNAEEGGDLEFWAGAIEYQKTVLDNLTVLEREDINANKENTSGKLLHFTLGQKPRRLRYLIGVYPTENNVYVVEAVGEFDVMTQHLDDLRSAFESIEF